MSKLTDLLSQAPETVVVDKYSGAEFTVAELTPMIGKMVQTDTYATVQEFCGRFEAKPTSSPKKVNGRPG